MTAAGFAAAGAGVPVAKLGGLNGLTIDGAGNLYLAVGGGAPVALDARIGSSEHQGPERGGMMKKGERAARAMARAQQTAATS